MEPAFGSLKAAWMVSNFVSPGGEDIGAGLPGFVNFL